jgi:hypothetical protein
VSPIKRHLSREKRIPTVRGVSSSPSVVGIEVNETNHKIERHGDAETVRRWLGDEGMGRWGDKPLESVERIV